MYVDGMNLCRIGRHLGLHHSTVSLWVKAYAANLPEAPKPEEVKAAEMDELFTFIGDKKTGSTSSPSLIGKHAASSAGKWPGNVHRRLFRMWLMQHPKPNAITVMPSMPMTVSGIIWDDMKSLKEKRIPTRLKRAMLSCVTIWLVWQGVLGASRVALMLLSVPFACLCIVSTSGSFISLSFQIILAK